MDKELKRIILVFGGGLALFVIAAVVKGSGKGSGVSRS